MSGDIACLYPEKSTTTTSTTTTGCLQQNVSFRGVEISSSTAYDVMQCAQQCAYASECHHFTFCTRSHSCRLMSAVFERNQRIGVISADMDCFIPDRTTAFPTAGPTTAAPTDPCYLHNVEYYGDVSGRYSVLSAESCLEVCRATGWCRFFSWDDRTGVCRMLRHQTGTRPAFGVVSGDVQCFSGQTTPSPIPDTTAAYPNECERQKLAYIGNDIRIIISRSAKRCSEACHELSGCRHFTFESLFKKCFLKSGRGLPKRLPGFISGDMDCYYPGLVTTELPPYTLFPTIPPISSIPTIDPPVCEGVGCY